TDLGSSVVSLATDPQGTYIYYAGTASGALYRSSDADAPWDYESEVGGTNWRLLTNLLAPVSALAVDPTAPSMIYAATSGRGVFRSSDRGRSWRSFNAGMSNRAVFSLTIDSNGKILHAGTAEGV